MTDATQQEDPLISAFYAVLCTANESHKFDFDLLLDAADKRIVQRIKESEPGIWVNKNGTLYLSVWMEDVFDIPNLSIEAAVEDRIKANTEDDDWEYLQQIAEKLDEQSLKLKSAVEKIKGEL